MTQPTIPLPLTERAWLRLPDAGYSSVLIEEGVALSSAKAKSNAKRWERGFTALSKFRAREGHCCPLQRHVEGNFKLGKWVSVQRYYKKFLLLERKRRLDAIGFVWDRRDNLWEQNFAALLKFKRREGHCCVPTFHREGDLKLGYWVSTQRRNKKRLSAARRARLNRLGFVWNGFDARNALFFDTESRRPSITAAVR